MNRFAMLAAGLVVAAAGSALSSTASADATCGDRANPCPLQKWMHDNMGAKLQDGKLDAVAASFDAVATMSPDPAWTDWTKIAKDGAAAARRGGDAGTRGARAACKSRHDEYKTLYRTRFRTRPV